jgi:hypothetical protein
MKTTFYQVFLIFVGILFDVHISGQTGVNDIDSIIIIKPKNYENLYKFFNNGDKEIQFRYLQKEIVPYKQSPIWRGIGADILTSLTGFGFNSSTEAYWKISGIISCNDMLPDWNVDLYCEGSIAEERERFKNDDGSWSVETNETYQYYWDKNAGGFLIEDNDTVGFFSIIMNPRENELLKTVSADILPQKDTLSKIKWSVFWMPSPGADYGVIGKFRDKDFIIIQNGTDRKAWIYTDNLFSCMFQLDLNYPRLRKKYIIMPYLIINKNIPQQDRPDLFRLAIVGRLLSEAISPHY